MADVRIERLHARYHQVTVERSLVLDRALADLVAGGLDAALGGAIGPEADRAWAICIPSVTVEVTLGEGGVAACTGVWADAVAGAVRAALEGRGPSRPGASTPAGSLPPGEPSRPVVFATRGDALVDLVRRVALGDHRRAWAWRQAGLLRGRGPGVDLADVQAALRAAPLLVPGVLREVGPEMFGRVVPPVDLAELAELVAVAAHLDAAAAAAIALPGPGGVPSAAVVRARAALPAGAGAAHPSEGARAALAVLAALTAAPHRSADPAFLAAVAASLSAATAPATPRAELSGVATTTVAAAEDPDPPASPGPDERGDGGWDEDEGERTAWGGVWFLATGLAATDLATTVASPHDLARLVATFTGAPYDDSAVRLLCGVSADDEPPELHEAVDPAALADLTGWLAGLVDGRLADGDPGEPWRRTAVMRRHPGEIEVELSLADVDPVVRAAGLDLDPGWVGWLGAFVRFRYA